MSGNVGEFVADGYDQDAAPPRVDPVGVGPQRVSKGHSWASRVASATASARGRTKRSARIVTTGLRIARSHPTDPGALYPVDRVARLRAYVGDHPKDVRASQALDAIGNAEAGDREDASPDWFQALPPAERPATPLPAGVRFGRRAGEYLHEIDGSVLVWVPAGSFPMGTTHGETYGPVHSVVMTRGFFLGKHEVTWRQWNEFSDAASHPSADPKINIHGERWEPTPNHPAYFVRHPSAVAYATWARLRLPTEAEWEYAARGPEGRTYPWGDEPDSTRGNFGRWVFSSPAGQDNRDASDGHLWPAPVGAYPQGASPFGALDMEGNVSEWVDGSVSPYSGEPRVDPVSRDGANLASRGGSWAGHISVSFSGRRGWGSPSRRRHTNGVRIALSHPGDPGALYPVDRIARLRAYLNDHPGDARAKEVLDTLDR
jgi:formylglycine-generating enzyme required for sulfatase activity